MSRVFEAAERARRAGSLAAGAESCGAEQDPVTIPDPSLMFPRERAEELSSPPPVPIAARRASIERRPRQEPSPASAATAPARPAVSGEDAAALAGKLITAGESPAAFTEYRRMAATLYQAQLEHKVRTVMVTSSMPAEGKSLTAANLALTLANAYRRSVLLIDGDMRRPTLDQLFGGKNRIGFLDCIRHGGMLPTAAIEVADGLHLLSGGTSGHDPVGELSSPKLREFFAHAAATYDWVIVDTPPAVLLPDAELVAGVVDASILVIEAGRTPYKNAQRVIETIGRDRFIGVVVNRAAQLEVPTAEYGGYYESHAPSEKTFA